MVAKWGDDKFQPLDGDNKKVNILDLPKPIRLNLKKLPHNFRAKTCKKELWQKIQVRNQQAHEPVSGQIGVGGVVGGGAVGGIPWISINSCEEKSLAVFARGLPFRFIHAYNVHHKWLNDFRLCTHLEKAIFGKLITIACPLLWTGGGALKRLCFLVYEVRSNYV